VLCLLTAIKAEDDNTSWYNFINIKKFPSTRVPATRYEYETFVVCIVVKNITIVKLWKLDSFPLIYIKIGKGSLIPIS